MKVKLEELVTSLQEQIEQARTELEVLFISDILFLFHCHYKNYSNPHTIFRQSERKDKTGWSLDFLRLRLVPPFTGFPPKLMIL